MDYKDILKVPIELNNDFRVFGVKISVEKNVAKNPNKPKTAPELPTETTKSLKNILDKLENIPVIKKTNK